MKPMRMEVGVAGEGPLRISEKDLPRCVVPACNETARWKGLCGSCYHWAKKSITSGAVKDWDELSDLGLCIVDDRPFLVELRKRLDARRSPASPVEFFAEDFSDVLKAEK